MTHLITMDLHQKEIQGFFDMPVDNLRAAPFLINYIEHKVFSFFSKLNLSLNKKNPNLFIV